MNTIIDKQQRWAILWQSKNELDGFKQHLIRKDCELLLFKTREEARKYNKLHYGYIRHRQDLKSEPHGWKTPKVVKINIDYSIKRNLYQKSKL